MSPCGARGRWPEEPWGSTSPWPGHKPLAPEAANWVPAAGDQDLARGQQHRCVACTGAGQRNRGAPRLRGRVVHLRAGDINRAIMAADNQDLARGQQRRRVAFASGGQRSRGAPRPRGRVVHLRAGGSAGPIPPVTRTLPVGSNVAVWPERALVRGAVEFHVSVAGSYTSALVGMS